MSLCQTKNLKQKHNKIRKRGCSSSTSSSSIFSRKYRFKRAILIGKKNGYSTPAPIWKTSSKSTSMATHHHHDNHHVAKNTAFHSFRSRLVSKENEISVSARKLAATIWEINDLTPSRVMKESMKSNKDRDGEKVESLCRSMLLGPQKFDLDLSSNRLFSEKESNKAKEKKDCGKCKVGVKNRLKEAKSGLSGLKKLLKVLSQMVVEERHSSRSMPLILAMSNELDHIHSQIEQFIREQSSNQSDVEYLMKYFEEEKNVWKRRERDTKRIAQELEIEKKLRKQTERMNMKFSKEIEKVKASYEKLSNEREREKRAKEILEQVCDELAKGIEEDRGKVEDMKRESEKVREEVEKEREMLHLADVLREERVHMKLSEAKYQFEEKNAMLENLRNELESLIRKKEEQEKGDNDEDVEVEIDQGLKRLKELGIYLDETFFEFQNVEEENDSIENEDESGESDLQSIELNMDNENKSYKWSYACENIPHFEAKRVSIDKDIGRRSFSDWGSICLNKGTKKKDFVCHNLESGKSIEIVFGDDEIEKHKEENERYSYKPIMSLGDYRSIPDSAKESGKFLSLRCIDGEAEENAMALEGCDMKKEYAPRK